MQHLVNNIIILYKYDVFCSVHIFSLSKCYSDSAPIHHEVFSWPLEAALVLCNGSGVFSAALAMDTARRNCQINADNL